MGWNELLDLLLRWFHVIAGIMWIGNSLLFNWLDRNLEKKEGIDGEIWLLHSGGFYQIEKKMLRPYQLPDKLAPATRATAPRSAPRSAACWAAGSSTIWSGARRCGSGRSWLARSASPRCSRSAGGCAT